MAERGPNRLADVAARVKYRRLASAPRVVGRHMLRRLGGSSWVRSVLRPLVRVPEDRTWVFVLGCYNSGTTLVHDLIAQSRNCARLPGEGVFLTSQLPSPEELGWTRMWWKVEDELRSFGRDGGGNPEIVKRDWSIWFDISRPVFAEKSVSNAIRVPWIERGFDQPRFVYLLRNGYAVAEGIRRRAGQGKYPLPEGMAAYPIEWCARQWVRSADVIDEDLASVDPARVFRFTYEELCADPRSWLGQLADFLGLADLERADVSAIADRNAEAIARLSQRDLTGINAVAGQALMAHGYRVLDAPART